MTQRHPCRRPRPQCCSPCGEDHTGAWLTPGQAPSADAWHRLSVCRCTGQHAGPVPHRVRIQHAAATPVATDRRRECHRRRGASLLMCRRQAAASQQTWSHPLAGDVVLRADAADAVAAWTASTCTHDHCPSLKPNHVEHSKIAAVHQMLQYGCPNDEPRCAGWRRPR